MQIAHNYFHLGTSMASPTSTSASTKNRPYKKVEEKNQIE